MKGGFEIVEKWEFSFIGCIISGTQKKKLNEFGQGELKICPLHVCDLSIYSFWSLVEFQQKS
jgi:hypothetical protein